MKKLIIIFIFITFSELLSQGFDWQISPRYPVEINNEYIGLLGEYGFISSNGSFNLIENNITCCKFNKGDGMKFALGAVYEKWISGFLTYNFALKYEYLTSDFEIKSELPTRDNLLVTKYLFNSKIHTVGLDAGLKYRIQNSHFNIGGGLGVLFNVYDIENHKEIALTDNVPFRERILSNGAINKSALMILEPYLKLGYDLSLGIGLYANPSLKLSYSLNSYLSDDDWRSLKINLELRIYKLLAKIK